ncbi:MAG: exonuclease SbcCD subunit D [Acidimicrobiaceae bacterium]|nr:exonuclease SbcCD subunit D [Acidimicrobiaceae bacterium]
MRLLHTSDWHVGKSIRGHGRADEHEAVLSEIAGLAAEHAVDLVLVAGDVFETAAPSAEAETIVYRALLELAGTGAEVAVIAGNHDNGRKLQAVAPVFSAAGGVRVLAQPARPDEGGVQRLRTRGGEDVRLAMLPFVSQRGIVRAKDLMDSDAYENAQNYAERMRKVIDALAEGFESDTVNVLMAHAFVLGGQLGGGERAAHFIDDYALSAQVFPASAGYVALGHVHRPQRIAGPGQIHYCGSPLQLDFGERGHSKQVNLVHMDPGLPPTVRPLLLSSGRSLLRLSGTLAELESQREILDDDPWLQVIVREPRRADLADRVREMLGDGVVDVRVEDTSSPAVRRPSRSGRTPVELFDEYLAEQNIDDERVRALFKELLDAQHDEPGEEPLR